MKVSLKKPAYHSPKDYNKYIWSTGEFVIEVSKAAGIVLLLSWFFYRSIWAILPISFLGVLYWKRSINESVQANRKKLVVQFQECILSVAASLDVGYSVENAFLESDADMQMLFGKHSFICQELQLIKRGLIINITLEELLISFGQRCNIPEIKEFAEVFVIAKRNGGSIPEIIRTSAEIISQKNKAEENITTLITSRRLEQKVMNVMPFGICIYVGIGNPGYFDSLYHNFFGVCLMSGCLIAYIIAYYLSNKILEQACRMW